MGTGRDAQNRGSLRDIARNYRSCSDNSAGTDVKILQDLCSSANQHTFADYHASRNVCPWIDHGTAADVSFVSQCTAKVTKGERF